MKGGLQEEEEEDEEGANDIDERPSASSISINIRVPLSS
jgi:hypothetical protein